MQKTNNSPIAMMVSVLFPPESNCCEDSLHGAGKEELLPPQYQVSFQDP